MSTTYSTLNILLGCCFLVKVTKACDPHRDSTLSLSFLLVIWNGFLYTDKMFSSAVPDSDQFQKVNSKEGIVEDVVERQAAVIVGLRKSVE